MTRLLAFPPVPAVVVPPVEAGVPPLPVLPPVAAPPEPVTPPVAVVPPEAPPDIV